MDAEQIEEMFNTIWDYFQDVDCTAEEGHTVLIIMLIKMSMELEITKSSLLAHLSNSWELNDPENDDPDKEKYPNITRW